MKPLFFCSLMFVKLNLYLLYNTNLILFNLQHMYFSQTQHYTETSAQLQTHINTLETPLPAEFPLMLL